MSDAVVVRYRTKPEAAEENQDFQGVQRDIDARTEEGPDAVAATVVGSYSG